MRNSATMGRRGRNYGDKNSTKFRKAEWEYNPKLVEAGYKEEYGDRWEEELEKNWSNDYMTYSDMMVEESAPAIEAFNETLLFHRLVADDYSYDQGSYVYVVDLSDRPFANMDREEFLNELDRLCDYEHMSIYGREWTPKYERRLIRKYEEEIERINDFLANELSMFTVSSAPPRFPNSAPEFFARSANRRSVRPSTKRSAAKRPSATKRPTKKKIGRRCAWSSQYVRFAHGRSTTSSTPTILTVNGITAACAMDVGTSSCTSKVRRNSSSGIRSHTRYGCGEGSQRKRHWRRSPRLQGNPRPRRLRRRRHPHPRRW